jgi:alpha-tubulin suppressor-like RCC1 family protein
MQFPPRLALIDKGTAIETIRLNSDRSVFNWPAAVKANAIADGIIFTTDGHARTPEGDLGAGIVSASAKLAMVFKNDGTARIFDISYYNALFQSVPLLDQLKDVVAGDGDPPQMRYYFLKRNGKVEQWTWNDPRKPVDKVGQLPLQLSRELPVDNVVEIKSMIGSLPLAMLRRDGTVVTVDYMGAIKDEMTYSSVMVPRPPNVGDVVSIATGYSHVLALRKNGTVLAWGANSDHECDLPNFRKRVVSIAAVGHMSYALTEDGAVVSWGSSR